VNKINPLSPPPCIGPPTLFADSGSTANYIGINWSVVKKRPTKNPIHVANPNGAIMTSTREGELDFPMLRPEACHAHIIPDLQNCSLLSAGQLCDAGYYVHFDAAIVRILDGDVCVLTGTHNSTNGMWEINALCTEHHDNALGTRIAAKLVVSAHATLFSPALSTLENALSHNYLTNFPGLTAQSLRKHPPRSLAMTNKGHMDQTRKNQRSIKTKPQRKPVAPNNPSPDPTPEPTFDGADHISASIDARTHHIYCFFLEPTGQIYTDQTGRFVTPSSNGNNYMMVCYDYDSNFIVAQPFRNRTAKCILDAYKVIHTRLCRGGLRPRLQRLDNECFQHLTDFLHEQDVDFQLVPPSDHRRNAAEHAIRTWQNHFIAGLCSVDKASPLHLWRVAWSH
jgi:hypothetical protein